MDLKETDILGEHIANHWHYRSKCAAMQRGLVGYSPDLDPQCRLRFLSHSLLDHTGATTDWCMDICYSQDFDAISYGKRVRAGNSVHPLLLRRSITDHHQPKSRLKRHSSMANATLNALSAVGSLTINRFAGLTPFCPACNL